MVSRWLAASTSPGEIARALADELFVISAVARRAYCLTSAAVHLILAPLAANASFADGRRGAFGDEERECLG